MFTLLLFFVCVAIAHSQDSQHASSTRVMTQTLTRRTVAARTLVDSTSLGSLNIGVTSTASTISNALYYHWSLSLPSVVTGALQVTLTTTPSSALSSMSWGVQFGAFTTFPLFGQFQGSSPDPLVIPLCYLKTQVGNPFYIYLDPLVDTTLQVTTQFVNDTCVSSPSLFPTLVNNTSSGSLAFGKWDYYLYTVNTTYTVILTVQSVASFSTVMIEIAPYPQIPIDQTQSYGPKTANYRLRSNTYVIGVHNPFNYQESPSSYTLQVSYTPAGQCALLGSTYTGVCPITWPTVALDYPSDSRTIADDELTLLKLTASDACSYGYQVVTNCLWMYPPCDAYGFLLPICPSQCSDYSSCGPTNECESVIQFGDFFEADVSLAHYIEFNNTATCVRLPYIGGSWATSIRPSFILVLVSFFAVLGLSL